jgi:hypothetical protein
MSSRWMRYSEVIVQHSRDDIGATSDVVGADYPRRETTTLSRDPLNA